MVATLNPKQLRHQNTKFQSPKMRINGCNALALSEITPIVEFQSPKMRINGCNFRSIIRLRAVKVMGKVSVPENED